MSHYGRGPLARRAIACAIAAAALFAATIDDASAAGARVTWAQQEDADAYRLYVAQPDPEEPTVRDVFIDDPEIGDDGNYFIEVHDVDPLRPAFFLMVALNWQSSASESSNILELGEGSFCAALDANGDGRVTTIDALIIARKAVGLGDDSGSIDGSIITALEILRLAATRDCS